MLPRDMFTLATVMTTSFTVAVVVAVANGAPADLEPDDYETLAEDEARFAESDFSNAREVRCYCNQPDCVPQGYMCRGRVCFTELPSNVNASPLKVEQYAYSGCLDESFKNRQCPTGFLCCGQDLCNHVDNPAMRNRLNKTLQVLIGNQRAYLSPLQPNSHGNQGEPRETADIWFKIAMITVPICGIVVLLVLASFAVRMLQPMPVSTPVRASGKLAPHRTSVNEPPLLGPPKVPLV